MGENKQKRKQKWLERWSKRSVYFDFDRSRNWWSKTKTDSRLHTTERGISLLTNFQWEKNWKLPMFPTFENVVLQNESWKMSFNSHFLIEKDMKKATIQNQSYIFYHCLSNLRNQSEIKFSSGEHKLSRYKQLYINCIYVCSVACSVNRLHRNKTFYASF